MKAFDIILLIILTLGAFKGFKRGFLMEIVSVVALILGIVGGLKLLQWGIELLSANTNIDSRVLPYISFMLIFVLIIVLVNLLGIAVKKAVHLTPLGNLDSIGGAITGILKWAFMLSVFLWITESFQINFIERFADNSVIYPWIAGLAPSIIKFISGAFPFVDNLLNLIQDFIGQHQ